MRPARALICMLALSICGCPRPQDDALEPNDDASTATPLASGTSIEARAVQDNADVFAIAAGTGSELVITLETLSGEVCPWFSVAGPDGTQLYTDGHRFCGRTGARPVAVPEASLEQRADDSFVLSVPAATEGTYLLTIRELGHADNLFDYAWEYRLTVTRR